MLIIDSELALRAPDHPGVARGRVALHVHRVEVMVDH